MIMAISKLQKRFLNMKTNNQSFLELIGLEPPPLVAGILPAPAGRLHSLTATSMLPFPPYSVGARFGSRSKPSIYSFLELIGLEPTTSTMPL